MSRMRKLSNCQIERDSEAPINSRAHTELEAYQFCMLINYKILIKHSYWKKAKNVRRRWLDIQRISHRLHTVHNCNCHDHGCATLDSIAHWFNFVFVLPIAIEFHRCFDCDVILVVVATAQPHSPRRCTHDVAHLSNGKYAHEKCCLAWDGLRRPKPYASLNYSNHLFVIIFIVVCSLAPCALARSLAI